MRARQYHEERMVSKRSERKRLRKPKGSRGPRGTASSSTSAKRSLGKGKDFEQDYAYVIKDLKRIGILAGTFVIILIALSFILR
jgi:hypothetical protein